MNRKITKKIGIPKRVFRTLNDISQFEEELFNKEMATVGITWTTNSKVSKDKYKIEECFYDPKTKDFVYIKPNEPNRDDYIKSQGLIPGMKHFTDNLRETPNKLSENPEQSFDMEIDPIIFDSKGKTPPSVPYLRVYLESSIGDSKSVHFVHNKTKNS